MRLIEPSYGPASSNRIVNGDFEEEPLNLGFDWRITQVERVFAGLDGGNYHSPDRALHIRFSGKENINYSHVSQFVSVEPRHPYRLTGFLKTEGITTDSGPRLAVHDFYDPSALQLSSESITGSTGGWQQVILDFTTGPKTILLVVSIARSPSAKLDNQIPGKIWVDDLSLTPLLAEGTGGRGRPVRGLPPY